MARITGTQGESVWQIRSWKGLNENPNGDTKLQLGEATLCDNWRITRDGNLQVRPGTKTVLTLADGEPVKAIWHGYIKGVKQTVAACGGKLWRCENTANGWTKTELGDVNTLNTVFMFGFAEQLYIMTGTQYRCYDGAELYDVTGYRPVVAVGVGPSGGGTTLEQVNKLNGTRRAFLSPDGKTNTFQLPEKDLRQIDWVKDRATGDTLSNYTYRLGDGVLIFDSGTASESFFGDGETTHFALEHQAVESLAVQVAGVMVTDGYTYNAALHEIVFDEAPAEDAEITISLQLAVPEGTNTLEVGWTVDHSYAYQIHAMRYAELYSGATDNRVFVYGDGSNLVFYSGVEYDGSPSAEYFPDMNILDIGAANTPVTSLIKHYSRLIAFKADGAYSIGSSSMTLPDGTAIQSFIVVPTNRAIGNVAPGQVPLILNDPVTLHGRDIYRWKNNSSYSSNLTLDERQARRISDRVEATAAQFDMAQCIMFDHNYAQTLYIVYRDRALVHNYAADVWYTYSNFPATCFVAIDRDLYYGDGSGGIRHVSETWRSDDGEEITAKWQSGSLPFGAEWLKKYSLRIFCGMKPESHSLVHVYTNSDRETDLGENDAVVVRANAINFRDIDFGDFTFSTAMVPRISRIKLKQKKYAYLQICLESKSAKTTARLTSMDVTVRNTVYMRTIK